MLSLLQQYWGHAAFRPLQREITEEVLAGRDTLATLPTGGGKSLCYQLPAVAMEGLCLVVSPLVALMEDQVAGLEKKGIPATALTAGSSRGSLRRKLEELVQGAYKLLYVSPERLQTRIFREYLHALPLSLVAVDEAHCLSQWGHDFRPEYLQIASLREVHTRVPVLALTASATPAVRADIIRHLKLREPAVFQQSLRRDNLLYRVAYSENKYGALAEALRQSGPGSGIVYCASRRHTEEVARHLLQQEVRAIAYHAGMARDKRSEAQAAWMEGRAEVMTATTAFGMGIDKADVRSVVHYDAPGELESYYQETGRAGRDGRTAVVTTFYNNTDIRRLRESTALRYPPEAYLRQVYQSVSEYLQIAAGTEPDAYFPFDLAGFCKRFGLQAVPASHALKLLAQEGLWTLTDAVFRPSTICFTAGRESLDSLSRRYPVLGNIILALLRLYSGIPYYPAHIRLPSIARQAKLRIAETETLLFQLQGMGILEYEPAGDGPQLYFHHHRVHSGHLQLNRERIRLLREAHLRRTEAMIRFLQNETACRTRLLLAYFEEEAPAQCGHCDVCLDRKKAAGPSKDLRAAIRTLLQEEALSLKSLCEKVTTASAADTTAMVRRMMDEGLIRPDALGVLHLSAGGK